ncbi:MAG TPA: hypothetical protein VIW29_11645 [Polyangiaceae bacterium]
MATRMAALAPWCVLVACGGPAEPAASPETEAAGERAAEGAPEAAPGAAAPADDDAKPASAAGSATSDADINAILQLVVDDPELDAHLHLGEPGRFPLQLAGEGLPSTLKLVKATEPVKLVAGPQSKKDAVLVVTEIEVQGDKATVRYRYDVEGVRGTVSLAKLPHGWELKNSRLVEH